MARIAEEGMLPIFRAQPGFISYRLVSAEDDTIISISGWDSSDQAAAATQAAASWVAENLAAKISLERNYTGAVVMSSD